MKIAQHMNLFPGRAKHLIGKYYQPSYQDREASTTIEALETILSEHELTEHPEYWERVKALILMEPKLIMCQKLPTDQVIEILREADILCNCFCLYSAACTKAEQNLWILSYYMEFDGRGPRLWQTATANPIIAQGWPLTMLDGLKAVIRRGK